MNETTMTTNEKTRPVHKIRLGNLSASIWENFNEDGKRYYRTTLGKSYRDARGEWKETNSFRSDDLVLTSTLARLAFEWTHALENES